MRNAWKKIKESKAVRFFVKFYLAICAIEIAVLLYFYDLDELLSMYLKLTGLDKYVN